MPLDPLDQSLTSTEDELLLAVARVLFRNPALRRTPEGKELARQYHRARRYSTPFDIWFDSFDLVMTP